MNFKKIIKGLPLFSKIETVELKYRRATFKKIDEDVINEVMPWDYLVGEPLTISEFCEKAKATLGDVGLAAVQLPAGGKCYPIFSRELQDAIEKTKEKK